MAGTSVAGVAAANGQSTVNDAIMTAVFYARCLSITLDHVPLQQQARIDMQDLLDVMIQQIRGEL